ncbi:NAD(P)-dependent oxidoreductase [Chondrinema litorale]|uniref:NAD(P)-dependent oxidoreductase n=1 Tax=Chondrinema litorale TaxID=2994555 RepID=UPI00254360F9|nr:NAD(P)-dependent oxidoreductase [Chondrinema litorale]UZR95153.1 phosphoglycerate dehydrogenase [Chondrinema litorale]
MKCLIIDEMYPGIQELLSDFGLQSDHFPDITPEKVLEIIPQYEGLILRSKMKVDIDFLEKAAKLKFIARAGAGVDQIDEDYLEKRQIRLFNAPEGNRDAVGEHALGMLLSLLNKLHTADIEVRNKQWRREANRGYEVKGKTVGIIGYGNMGKAFAKRLRGFECTTIAYDIKPDVETNSDAQMVDLETLFNETDILSLHIPLTPISNKMVDEAFLDKFKKPIYLINTARGPVVPFSAVKYGLEKELITAAGLDVLENEKLSTLTPNQAAAFDYISKLPNVLLSPHVGGWTFESYKRINEVLAEKIKKAYFE